ncbi:hypothetical protein VTN31DRAFT_5125 [Thermomyces dupontii]|uniref:uncharacterized protein n=1 Tax=Talaromyces thermophilus TaxID=28565 RepID=UPI0037427E97
MSYNNPRSQVPKTSLNDRGIPPGYAETDAGIKRAGVVSARPAYAKYDPRGWSRRTQIIAGLITVAVIVAVIAGAVEGVKANRYPDYYPLNYRLVDTYEGRNFFDQFRYWSDPDPTHGFVVYLNAEGAAYSNLTYASDDAAVIKVDTQYDNAIGGRNSIRIESKRTYDRGLFIFDIAHAPHGCGTWPALWLSDTYNWPTNGEIDVVEATNKGTFGNSMTLHTTEGCTMNVRRKQTGSVVSKDCYNATNNNEGCGVKAGPASFGPEFNDNGGGVYATELREEGIRIWFFPRGSIPADITTSRPDPSRWGKATADFPNTKCDISRHFRNQSIIANIALCGDLAGQASRYREESECPGECPSFVAQHPEAFREAYWEFRSIKVYQAENA